MNSLTDPHGRPSGVETTSKFGANAAVRLNILVVEDELLVSLDIAAMLANLGHIPVEANSGPQALAILEERPGFDLVLSDYQLSGMSGGELLTIIRQRWPTIRTAILSGYSRRAPEVPLLVPWLAKPVSPKCLTRLLDELGPWAAGPAPEARP